MTIQKWELFKCFKTTNGSLSVVSHCSFEETYILLDDYFMQSGMVFVPTPYIKLSVAYDHIIKHVQH